MSNRILLVEDSKEVYRMVTQALGPAVTLDWADTVSSASEKLTKLSYDLILLDIELPDGNGLTLCSKIHINCPRVPIFFITSHNDLSKKVLGFSAGADDYITKPFNLFELKARVDAKLKKQELLKEVGNCLKWKEIEINKSSQEVKVFDGNNFAMIELTALEFKLLTYFAAKPGTVISRNKILDDIWGKEIHVYARSVDTHVSKLRKKLRPVAQIIESIHGAGYKFSPSDAHDTRYESL